MKEKTQMIAFRYNTEKKCLLVKAFGKELPELFRKYADRLVLKAIEEQKLLTRNKNE